MQMVITPSRHNAVRAQTLNAGERGMGISQAQISSRDRNGDQPGCGPGEGQATCPTVPGTSACSCGLAKLPAHCPLQLWLAWMKPAQVLGACGWPEEGKPGSRVRGKAEAVREQLQTIRPVGEQLGAIRQASRGG
uniref:Uncharacterized protein n=1 Tax=Myotis myotis TaxID=51298 RepID=A0A7J7ZWW7_MYOMY|nr:hypothetical protein mMyoMyo1_009697 [Myotis myotis]